MGNVPFQATEEELGNWFKQAGVTSANVTLVRDRFTGQPRGFGFVEMNNDDDAIGDSLHCLDMASYFPVLDVAMSRSAASLTPNSVQNVATEGFLASSGDV